MNYEYDNRYADIEQKLLLCSVEQMQRCAEGLAMITEPIVTEPVNPVNTPEAAQDAAIQESPVPTQPSATQAEEMPAAATFYF